MKNFLRKNMLTGAAGLLGVFLFAVPALAATTVSLSPSTINAVVGKSFTVTVSINPQGSSNYAEKLEIDYPASVLQVTGFTLGGTWTALNQPGYDSTDNANGVLIKTAGYPAGFSSPITFGTISFVAKKAGKGSITIGEKSLAFESNSQNGVTGNSAAVTVSAPVATPVSTVSATTTSTTTEAVVVPVTPAPIQVAAVTAAVPAGSSVPTWAWFALLAVIALAAVVAAYRMGFRR